MIKLINILMVCSFCVAAFFILTTPKLAPYRAAPDHEWKQSNRHGVTVWYKSN